MDFVLILHAQIISLLLQRASSQYDFQAIQNAYYPNAYQNPYQNYPTDGYVAPNAPENLNSPDYYEEPQSHRRYSKSQRRKPYGSSGGKLPTIHDESYEDSEECKCSCNNCEDPEPCCKNACNTCITQPQPSQQNVVIVPYPYPLVVPPKIAGIEVTPAPSTNSPVKTQNVVPLENKSLSLVSPPEIERSSSSSPAPILQPPSTPKKETKHDYSSKHEEYEPNEAKYKPNYIMTSLRRTKPVWLPKYGIVPIPDRLAEKLMSKLREVKGLKARETDNRFE